MNIERRRKVDLWPFDPTIRSSLFPSTTWIWSKKFYIEIIHNYCTWVSRGTSPLRAVKRRRAMMKLDLFDDIYAYGANDQPRKENDSSFRIVCVCFSGIPSHNRPRTKHINSNERERRSRLNTCFCEIGNLWLLLSVAQLRTYHGIMNMKYDQCR